MASSLKKPINKVPVKQRSSSFADPLHYKVIKDETVNLTKERAYEFLEMTTFQGERAVSENHVQFLFDEWAGGRFIWHHIILACAELNGTRYRINGQHTCWMRINIPAKAEPVKADCREITYRVDTEDQLRTLYSTFDRNKTRSVGHVSKVLLMETPAGRDLPGHIIGKMVAGFKVYWCEDWSHMARDGMNTNEVIGLITKRYSDLFNVVGHFVRIHMEDHTFVRRSATIAAMLATFEKSVQAAGDFWTPVCEGIGLEEKTDPRYQLRQFLLTHNHNFTQRDSNVVSVEDAYRVAINAWNKWRRKESAQVLRTTDKRNKPV